MEEVVLSLIALTERHWNQIQVVAPLTTPWRDVGLGFSTNFWSERIAILQSQHLLRLDGVDWKPFTYLWGSSVPFAIVFDIILSGVAFVLDFVQIFVARPQLDSFSNIFYLPNPRTPVQIQKPSHYTQPFCSGVVNFPVTFQPAVGGTSSPHSPKQTIKIIRSQYNYEPHHNSIAFLIPSIMLRTQLVRSLRPITRSFSGSARVMVTDKTQSSLSSGGQKYVCPLGYELANEAAYTMKSYFDALLKLVLDSLELVSLCIKIFLL
jgi:hypothetical protein